MSIPPIYVINLKRAPERRLYMQRQLDAFNLDYQIVDAIDKYDLLSKEYRMKIAEQLDVSKTWMEEAYLQYRNSKGDAAGFPVSLSSIKVFNMMKKDNISMACILEDDTHLLLDFPKILRDSQKISWDALQISSYSGAFFWNLVRIIEICPGSSPLSKDSFINLLQGLKKLGHYTLQLPLYTAYRLIATIIQIIFESIIGYFYFLVVGRSNRRYYGWRIRTFVYRNGASHYINVHCASKIGGLPIQDKKLWYRLGFKYCIVPPQEPAGSAGGYMITLQMADTFKKILTSECLHVDQIFYKLAEKGMKSYILSPSCVEHTLRYILYSAKDRQ